MTSVCVSLVQLLDDDENVVAIAVVLIVVIERLLFSDAFRLICVVRR